MRKPVGMEHFWNLIFKLMNHETYCIAFIFFSSVCPLLCQQLNRLMVLTSIMLTLKGTTPLKLIRTKFNFWNDNSKFKI